MWLFCPLRAAMADGVRKTVAFLATYVEELVRLQKPTLEAVLKSNRTKQVKEWKAAQNFWERKRQTLTVEQQNLFEDWEFVLCNMSTLETVAFLPRLQRCFQRVESFFTEQGGALQKVGARNLQLALRSPHMLQFPTSTFVRVFLERYLERCTPEQSEVISVWEAQLCQISAEAQERARRSCAQAFLRLQEFFAKFAKDILDLQKENLRDVVMSNQAHRHPEWMRAQNFFLRQHPLLTVEERDLLDDWELVLCEMSTLETVAFLPRLQRCFQRVESFFTEQRGALQKVGARNLQLALRSPHMVQFPTATFVRVFWSGIWKALHQSRAKSFQCGKPNFVRSVQKPKNELVVRARRHFCACKNFLQSLQRTSLGAPPFLRGRRGTMCTAKGSDVRPGVPWGSASFAWQAWDNVHCQGVRCTPWRPLGLRLFCVAGVGQCALPRGRMYALASLGAPPLSRERRGTMCTAKESDVRPGVPWRSASFAWQGQAWDNVHCQGVRCTPWRPLGLRRFCVAGVGQCALPRGPTLPPSLTPSLIHSLPHCDKVKDGV